MTDVIRSSSLGFLLATPPQHPASVRTLDLVSQALAGSARVYGYCVLEGVCGLASEMLQSLCQHGLKLTACAFALEQHRVRVPSTVTPGGLSLLARIIAGVDTFAPFHPRLPEQPTAPTALDPGSLTGSRRRIQVQLLANPSIDALAAEGLRIAAGLTADPALEVELDWPAADRCRLTEPPDGPPWRDLVQVFVESGGLMSGRTAAVIDCPTAEHARGESVPPAQNPALILRF